MATKNELPKRAGLAGLLNELNEELESEKFSALKPEQQSLEVLTREILRLERDMMVPGSPTPDNIRVERLMRFIEEKDF